MTATKEPKINSGTRISLTFKEICIIGVFLVGIGASWANLKTGQTAIIARLTSLETTYSDHITITERMRSEREDDKYTKKELDSLSNVPYMKYADDLLIE